MRPAQVLTSLLVIAAVALGGPGSVDAQTSEELASIDSLRDAGEYGRAMALLDSLTAVHGEKAALLWRIAWTHVDIGEATRDSGEQERMYRRAAEEARRAVELDPADASAHMVQAIAVGRVALTAGTREKIELSRQVRESADEAIRLDQTLDGAYHVRARWHHEVASLGFVSRNVVRLVYGGLPEASYELAVEDFLRAIRLNDRVLHRLELARTYLAMGYRSEARSHLEHAVEMVDDDANARVYREEANQLLRRIR
jgi:tetratricopeptide (TPR) repeat protein